MQCVIHSHSARPAVQPLDRFSAEPEPPAVGTDLYCGSVTPADEHLAKEQIIRSLIRRTPSDEVTRQAVDILSVYPKHALEIVAAFGTKIEFYDFAAGDAVPEYVETLSDPRTLGCYNALANVLGMDRNNVTTVPLTHEFAHALDAALGDISKSPQWKGAHTLATATERTVRDYAKSNSCEYLAETTTAYLISDERLPALIEDGLSRGAYGMEERDFLHMHQNLCNGRLKSMDPDGYALADDLLHRRIHEGNLAAPLPALDEASYHAAVEKEKAARK